MDTNFVTRCWLWDKPLQEARDGFFLDGGGLFIADSANGTLQGICEGKFRKKHN